MRPLLLAPILAALATLGAVPAAPAQAVPPAGQVPTPAIRIVPAGDDEAPPSLVAAEAPPADDFIVLPLRAHVLAATDLPGVACGLLDADVRRVVAKVNGIWHQAGIHWALDPIVREAAARQDDFRRARADGAADDLDAFRLLAPAESRSEGGVDVYYIHAFPVNGVYLGERVAFVQETAQLRPVPGGIDEPLPRVTAHELGHALGLPHRQARTNLLASGTTGTTLNRVEVDRARSRAARLPGAATVPDLRRRRDEATARPDPAEADRLAAILRAIEGNGATP